MALHTAGKAIEWSIQQNNAASIAESYFNRAGLLQLSGQYQSSIQDYSKVISTDRQFKLHRDDLVGMAYIGIVKAFFNLEQFDEGVRLASEGFVQTALVNQPEIQRELQRWRAKCLAELKRYDEAVNILEEVLKQSMTESSRENEAETLFQLGVLFEKSGDFDKSENYLKRAKELATWSGSSELVIQSNDALASVYRQTFNTDMELMTRNSNIALNQQSNDMSGVAIQNFEIGNAYLQKGDINLAENFIVKGKDLSPIHSKDGKLIQGEYSSAELRQGALALKNLAEEFLRQEEMEKALKYYQDYSEMLDSANALQQLELKNAMVLSTDLGRNQERVALLERENELNARDMQLLREENTAKDVKVSTRNMVIILLLLMLLLVVVFVFYTIKNNKARRRSEQLVALQGLSGQMNPHFIFNALNSVNEYIAKNDEREANRFITAFSRLMRRVLDDSKNTFIPLSDEIEMLKVYIQLEHSRFPEQFQYHIECDGISDPSDIFIPPMMIQPLLENAIWHGLRYRKSLGELWLEIKVEGNKLVILVRDNGIGIERSQKIKTGHQRKQSSHAVSNMHSRMSLLNKLYPCRMEISVNHAFPDLDYPGTEVRFTMESMRLDKINE